MNRHPISTADFLPLADLRATQLARLQGMVSLAYDNVKLFRQRLDERGLKPADIRTACSPGR